MDKAQLKKNKLDLEYHGEAQKINAFLILLTTGSLAFLGTFVWLKESQLFFSGIGVILVVLILGWVFYNKSSKRMKEILDEIENIQY